MIAAREPKMKKSYHSKTVPAADAATTSAMCRRPGAATACLSAMGFPPANALASGRAGRPARTGGVAALLKEPAERVTLSQQFHSDRCAEPLWFAARGGENMGKVPVGRTI